MTKTWYVGCRHMSTTNSIIDYKKLNAETMKLVKFIKGRCSICGRNKSQVFTK